MSYAARLCINNFHMREQMEIYITYNPAEMIKTEHLPLATTRTSEIAPLMSKLAGEC